MDFADMDRFLSLSLLHMGAKYRTSMDKAQIGCNVIHLCAFSQWLDYCAKSTLCHSS